MTPLNLPAIEKQIAAVPDIQHRILIAQAWANYLTEAFGEQFNRGSFLIRCHVPVDN